MTARRYYLLSLGAGCVVLLCIEAALTATTPGRAWAFVALAYVLAVVDVVALLVACRRAKAGDQ